MTGIRCNIGSDEWLVSSKLDDIRPGDEVSKGNCHRQWASSSRFSSFDSAFAA